MGVAWMRCVRCLRAAGVFALGAILSTGVEACGAPSNKPCCWCWIRVGIQARSGGGRRASPGRGFVDTLRGPSRLRAAEGGADGEVEIAGGFEELLAGVEGMAAVRGNGQAGEEHAGALAELLGEGGQVLCAVLAAQQHVECRGPALQSGDCRPRGRSNWRPPLRARAPHRRPPPRPRAGCRRRARRRPRCLTARSAKKRW